MNFCDIFPVSDQVVALETKFGKQKRLRFFAFLLMFFGFLIVSASPLSAQSAANYAFTTSTTGSLTDMSSGTTILVGASQDDAASVVTPIGFDFYFMGFSYSQFSVNSNGLLRFGGIQVQDAGPYSPLGQASIPLITACGADQRTTSSGKVHYKVIGTAPNRILVVEWLNMYSYYTTPDTIDYTYQVRLQETTGIIEFVYGSMRMSFAGAGEADSREPHIGFSANNTANSVGYITAPQSGTPVPSYTSAAAAVGNLYTAGTISVLNSTTQGSRRVFTLTPTFTPPPPVCTISGTKTIPGDYPSITAALTALTTNGIAGHVILELQPSYSSVGETFPIQIGNLPCNSAANTVTIRPAVGATGLSITGNSADQIFDFNIARYVTIDGRPGGTGTAKEITISNTNTSGSTIRFINDAQYNTIRYCNIRGVNNSALNGVIFFSTTIGTTGCDNNTITNCDIGDGATQPTNIIYSAGSTANITLNNSNNTISNNNIFNYYSDLLGSHGIFLSSGNTDWIINGNKFFQNAPRVYSFLGTHYGIRIDNTSGNNFNVNNNVIGYASATGTGTYTMSSTAAIYFIGISLNVGIASVSEVQGNTIAGFNFSTAVAQTTGPGNWAGISITAGRANIGTTTGNIIGDASTGSIVCTTSVTGGLHVGINSSSTSIVNIMNNTIGSITVNGSSTSISASIAGILVSAGTNTISGNTIGNVTVANSLNAATASNSSTGQYVTGIISSSSTAATITNNTIANLTNAYVGTATAGQVRGIVTSAGTNQITGNTIRNLSTASLNTSAVGASSTVIGISQTGTTAPQTITQNVIHTLTNTAASASVSITGIHYAGPTAGVNTIGRNFIHSLNLSTTATGAALAGINISSGIGNFQNNMVRLGIDASGASLTTAYVITGILKATTAVSNFYHNSVYIGGTGVSTTTTNTYAFRRTSVGADDIRNNIFVNDRSNATTGGKHMAYVHSATTIGMSNYNIYQANGTGGVLASLDGGTTNRATIQALRENFSGQDLNSGTADPNFINALGSSANVDLHLLGTAPAESAGIAIAAVVDDFDGQTRSGLTPVDIGADAGNFTASDEFTPNIVYTPLTNTTSTANRTLSGVTILDIGTGVPTTGPNMPRIWFRNFTALPATWASTAGSLISGTGNNGTWDFTIDYSLIGGAPSAGDIIQYYIVAQDQATPNIWYSPFAGASHSSVTTQTSAPTTPNSYTVGSALAGTIQVGFGQTYVSLTSAGGLFQAINSGALSGNLTVEIVSDLTEDGTYPLNQWTEIGAGNYTLTIKSSAATLRTISGAWGGTGLIRLDGADRVTFDGRFGGSGQYLLIRNGTTSTSVIQFINGATNNTIRNCILEGMSTVTDRGVVWFSTSTTTAGVGNSYNTITACDIKDGASTPVYGIYSSGSTTTGLLNQNNTISDNSIYNMFAAATSTAGVFLTSGNTDWSITGNRYFQTSPRAYTGSQAHYGIQISNTSGNNFNVSGNTIGYASSTGTGIWTSTSSSTTSFQGITLNVGTTTASNVQGNTITAISFSSTSTTSTSQGYWCGINIQGGNVNIGTSVPNVIGSGSSAGAIVTSTSGQGGLTVGINSSGSGTLNISNNIIGGITSSGSTSSVSANIAGVQVSAGSNTISGNTIGSSTIVNSINASGGSTSATAQNVTGIISSSTGTVTIANNTVANMTNSYTGTSTSAQIRGIVTTNGVNIINNNTIQNLSTASGNTSILTNTSVIGISQGSTTAGQTISQNTIHSLSNANPSAAVHIAGLVYAGPSSGTSNIIARNFIHSLSLATASASSTIIGINAVGGLATYQNNMVRLGMDATGLGLTTEYYIGGIVKASTSNCNFWFNSVYIGGANVGSVVNSTSAFTRSGSGTDNIRNNIFVNDRSNATTGGTHFAYVLNNTTGVTSDFNLYRASGTGGAHVSLDGGTTPRNTMQSLRENFSGQEMNSGMGDPNFVNPTGDAASVNLHVTNPTPAEGSGAAIPAVTDDYDGQTRGGLTATDIGADAGIFTYSDVFTPNISYAPLGVSSNTVSRVLPNVTITDVQSGVPVSGGNVPRVWFKNQTTSSAWASSPGTLTSGSSTNGVWSFTITYSLVGGVSANDVIQYYVAAQDQAPTPNVWYSPFIGAAHTSVSTQTTPPTTPNSYTIASSVVTVGTGGNFASLTGAGGLFAAINSGALSDDMIVEIVSDLTEDGTNALNQWTEIGTGGYTITIRPSSAIEKLISGNVSVSGGMIRLNGADRVTFDGRYSGTGKYLRFRNENTAQPTITLINDATYNTIRNCYVEGATTASQTNGVIFLSTTNIATNPLGNSYNTIAECEIRDLSNVTATPGTMITSIGTTAGPNRFNTVSNNYIYNFFGDGITSFGLYLSTATLQWNITGNHFYQTTTRLTTLAQTGFMAIWAINSSTGGGFDISGNYVGGSAPFAGGSPWTVTTITPNAQTIIYAFRLDLATAIPSSFQGNVIKNFDLTTSSASVNTIQFTGGIVVSGTVNMGNITPNIVGENTGNGSITVTINGANFAAAVVGFDNRGIGSTVQNNSVGSITVQGTTTRLVSITGISVSTNTSPLIVSGNLIGSLTTPNSILGLTSADSLIMRGIISSIPSPGNVQIANNTVANISNLNPTIATQLRGIMHTGSGQPTIENNQIFALTSAGTSPGTGTTSLILGLQQTGSGAPAVVKQNRIHTLTATNTSAADISVYGMHYSGATTGTTNLVSRNFIHSISLASASTAATIVGINVGGGTTTYQNNMIRLGIDAAGNPLTTEYVITGITRTSTNPSLLNNYYHNSVYIGGSGVGSAATNTYAFARQLTGNDNLRNNIFVNDRSNSGTGGKHYALALNDITTITSDYNILRAGGTGGVLATVDNAATDLMTLKALRENFIGQEQNSGVGNPNFIAPVGTSATVDLHVTHPTPAEGAGIAIASVTDDYDGQTRSGLTPTDIGADAGNFTTTAATDIFPPVIAYTPLGNASNTANRTLSGVTINDVGTGVPTTGANAPRIWFRNQTTSSSWASTSGALNSGNGFNGQWSFTIDYSLIGGAPSAGHTIQYYIVAQDQASPSVNIWYSPFEGASHTNVSTQVSPPTVPNSYIIGSALAGTVSVGTGQTYTSLTNNGGLFEAINNGALSGNLTVQITSDLTENGTNPLNQWIETGVGGYILTIQPSAAVERLISGNVSVTDGLIRLNGADRVTIDGRFGGSGQYLRFRNTNINQPCISIHNDATYNTIRNCILEGATSLTTNGVLTFGAGSITGNSYNTIQSCDIRDLSNITGIPANGIFSIGNASAPNLFNRGNTIINSKVYNFFSDGFVSYGCYIGAGNTDWTIDGNSFYQTAARNSAMGHSSVAIFIQNTSGGNFAVINNSIGGSAPNASGSPWILTTTGGASNILYGMYLEVSSSTPSSIQGNVITNIDLTTTPLGGMINFVGILVANGQVNTGDLVGNVIGASTGTGAIQITSNGANTATFEGIDYRGTTTGSIQNNAIGSFSFFGASTATQTFNGISLISTIGTISVLGNTIGSSTTANSIQSNVSSLLLTVTGIVSSAPLPSTIAISNNIIANCSVNCVNTTAQVRGIAHTGTAPISIENNQIYNLSTASTSTGTTTSASLIGIQQSNGSAPILISRNRIHSLANTNTTSGAANYVIGIYYTGPTVGNNIIERNFIHSLSIGSTNVSASLCGIYIAGGLSNYQNNMIRLGIDAAGNSIQTENIIRGIWKNTTTNNNFYHNSVYIGGTGVGTGSAATYAYQRSSTGLDDIRNNIFANERSNATTGGKHYAMWLNAVTSAISDYNIYRASGTGGILASVDGGSTDRLTLQILRENFPGQDLNSGVGNPNFVNPASGSAAVDLHASSPTPVEGAGIAIGSVINDYDGQTRSLQSPVDIGADAENFTTSAATDIFPPTITYTPFGNTPSNLNRILSGVTITDVGTGVSNVSNQPRIWYRNVSLGSPWASAAGIRTSGTDLNGQWSFTIDYSLAGGTPSSGHVIAYYIVVQDQASMPNLWYSPFIGASHTNVAIQITPPAMPNTYTITGTSFSGTVSVGSGQTYTSLTNTGGLFEAINNGSLSGNVTVNITSDLFETGTHALNQWGEDGIGGYTLTIQPSAALERLIYGDVFITNGMIRLNGADRVIFDGRFGGSGRYLRLRNINTAQPTITLINDAVSNTFRNCIIEGATTSTSNGVIFLSAGILTGNDNNTITANIIRDRSDALSVPAYCIMSAGTSSSIENSGNTISDNEIFNFATYGVNVTSTGNGNGWNISGNSFYNNLVTPPAAAQTSIYFIPGLPSSGNTISGNYIGGQAANAGGSPWTNTGNITFWGMSLSVGVGSPTSVQNNTISNIALTGTGAASFIGIQGTLGNLNIGTVTGNIIGHASTTGSITTAGTALQRGIGYSGNDNIVIQNNIIANIAHTTITGVLGLRAIEINGGVANVSDNQLYNLSSSSIVSLTNVNAAVHGIDISSSLTGHVIEGNVIHTLTSNPATPFVSTTVQGMRFSVGSGTVRRNRIHNLVNNSSGGQPNIFGIYGYSGSWTVVNNMIALGSGLTNSLNIQGLRDSSTAANYWHYNTVLISGAAGSGVTNSYCYVRLITSLVSLRNNIFLNERTGGSGYHYAIGNLSATPATNWPTSSSNYNLLVGSDATRIGEWGTTPPTNRSFSDWKSSSGSDANSWSDISANVTGSNLFVNPASGDLHIQGANPEAWYVNGKGTQLSSVTTDFDNQTRSATVPNGATDIGADEFSPAASPAVIAATPALGGTNTIMFAGRPVGSITWSLAGTVPTSLSARYYSGQNPPSPMGNYSNAYWDISAAGGSGYTYDITLYYDPAILGTIPQESNIRLAKRDGVSPWVHYAASTVNTTNKTVTMTGLTTFSDFALSDNANPLPVELVAFTAKLQGTQVQLDWKTASELNSFRYYIERSAGAGVWQEIGFVDAQGSVDVPTLYSYIDYELPAVSELYYRLRLVDRNGTYTYSNEVRVALGTPDRFELFINYPNPFASVTTISFAIPSEEYVTIRIYDMTGRAIEELISGSMSAGNHSVSFYAKNLPSGMYQYVITAGDRMKTGTMILAR